MTDAAGPDDGRRSLDDGRRSLMAEEAKSFRSYCLARNRSEKAKGGAGESRRAAPIPWRPSAPLPLARDHAPRRFIDFVGSSFWGQRIKGDWRALLRRSVDFFANVRVVDCFPFGEIFLRTPCAEIWPRQRRAQADAFIEPNAIKLALRTTRSKRRRSDDERRDGQRRPHGGKADSQFKT
jgi:hypothetical protein